MDRGALAAVNPAAAPVETSAAPLPFWDLIDAVLVINLDQRPERWARLQAATRGLIPAEKLHRVPAIFGRELPGFGQRPWFRGRRRDLTWAARAGCTLSHRRALATAREAGWGTVLILEDDVEFSSNFAPLAASLHAALAPGGPAAASDLYYLGYTDPEGPARSLAALGPQYHLAQVYGCNCAHAYVVTARVRNWLLARLPDETHIWSWLAHKRAVDRWYLRTLGRHFQVTAVAPSLVNQLAGFSDIVGRAIDYVAQDGHRLTVAPGSGAGPLGYAFGMCAHSLRNRALDAYDAFRALGKRLHGF